MLNSVTIYFVFAVSVFFRVVPWFNSRCLPQRSRQAKTGHLSSVICLLSSVFRHLSSVICTLDCFEPSGMQLLQQLIFIFNVFFKDG